MQEEYFEEFEELILDESAEMELVVISISDRIRCLEPEIIEMIQTAYGDIDTYGKIIEKIKGIDYLLDHLETLKLREQKVIMLRLGLLDGKAKSLFEVADIMGLTPERIRQIEHKCFRHRCCPRRSKKLRDFLEDKR